MNSDCEIADAIKAAQRLLWHTYDLPDAMKVAGLRKLVCSSTVQSALQCSSDTLAFTLRAVELVIADQSRTDREMIRALGHPLEQSAPDSSRGATELPHLDRPGSRLG